MSRTIHRKSPEFNASNDQNVILSKTVLKVKLVLPPSLEILEILKNIYFQIPRETRSNFDALSVWFLLTQYNVTLSKLYFTCQWMIFCSGQCDTYRFGDIWYVTSQICASYVLRHGDIYRLPRLGVAAGQCFERPSKLQSEKKIKSCTKIVRWPFHPEDGRNGSPSKNPDIKTPLVAKNWITSPSAKLTTSGVLMSRFFEGLPLS